MMNPIIDVSSHNGVIDWGKVEPQISSAIIRIGYRGYGSRGRIMQDTQAEDNIMGCFMNGIPFSFYFFPTSISIKEAAEEGKWIDTFCKEHKVYPASIFLDSEDANPKGYSRNKDLSRNVRTLYLAETVRYLNHEGYVTGIYCSDSWSRDRINMNEIPCHGYWIARYGTKEPKSPYVAWQYTSKGHIDGINGYVDFSARGGEERVKV